MAPPSPDPRSQASSAAALPASTGPQAAYNGSSQDPATMLHGGYTSKKRVQERYKILGFISSGTYGRVFKAQSRTGQPGLFAIKKFKPDKEGEVQYTGISQSAIREMALCTELSHPNVVHTVEIILEDKCIFIVFEYAEHDLLQIVHHHTQNPRQPIPAKTIQSILWQLLKGLHYLHQNWVMHRDLKPANIMVTGKGAVKIGDLGLARLFYKPLGSLYSGDKVVVTIWYRAPELLLGSRHYTPAVDLWAVGCIFAELLALRPIFKGEEAKLDNKKQPPFQRNQMQKIVEILGLPKTEDWPLLRAMPEYSQLPTLHAGNPRVNRPVGLKTWYDTCMRNNNYPDGVGNSPGPEGYSLLQGLLEYDPQKRLTAEKALKHPYFKVGLPDGQTPSDNCFAGSSIDYPRRAVKADDNDIRTGSLPGTKRSGLPDDSLLRPAKRLKEAVQEREDSAPEDSHESEFDFMAPYRWRGPTPYDPQMAGFAGSGTPPEDASLVAPTQQDVGAEDYMSMLPSEYADLSSYGPQRFLEASPPPDSPEKKDLFEGKVSQGGIWAVVDATNQKHFQMGSVV